MRIRLQLLLPLVVAGLVAAGFLVVALLLAGDLRAALITVPGLTVDRAVESAVRVVAIAGVAATVLAAGAGYLIARMIVAPLARLRAAADRPAEGPDADGDSPVAEIQDVARGVDRAVGELRARHAREVRERSELAGLVEAVSEGIIQIDPAGRIARLNQAARSLLGLPDDAVGRPVGALVRSRELRRILAPGAGGVGAEAVAVEVDERRILVSMSPQPGGGAVATVVDLTDLRRLEEVRRDFVANASHELKTPLTSIRGYTETLLGGELPEPERRQFLATIARNTERLQRIVDDLLDLSRLEAGRWRPELEPVDLLEVAGRCWQPFAERAAEQGVVFGVEDATVPPARADRQAMEQVFANLYDNALRHTDREGSIRVAAWLEAPAPAGAGPGDRAPDAGDGPEGGGRRVVCEVTDTGSGIPRDALPRIFERFYRVDPARSRADGGTGLGLSIVRHLLGSMGGDVDARSELGKGTTIRIRLPAA